MRCDLHTDGERSAGRECRSEGHSGAGQLHSHLDEHLGEYVHYEPYKPSRSLWNAEYLCSHSRRELRDAMGLPMSGSALQETPGDKVVNDVNVNPAVTGAAFALGGGEVPATLKYYSTKRHRSGSLQVKMPTKFYAIPRAQEPKKELYRYPLV